MGILKIDKQRVRNNEVSIERYGNDFHESHAIDSLSSFSSKGEGRD